MIRIARNCWRSFKRINHPILTKDDLIQAGRSSKIKPWRTETDVLSIMSRPPKTTIRQDETTSRSPISNLRRHIASKAKLVDDTTRRYCRSSSFSISSHKPALLSTVPFGSSSLPSRIDDNLYKARKMRKLNMVVRMIMVMVLYARLFVAESNKASRLC